MSENSTMLNTALGALAVFGPAHVVLILLFGANMWNRGELFFAFFADMYAMYCTVYFAHIFMVGLACRKTGLDESKQNF